MNVFISVDRYICTYVNSQCYPVAVLHFHVRESRDVKHHWHFEEGRGRDSTYPLLHWLAATASNSRLCYLQD